jgi:hypothetical protein
MSDVEPQTQPDETQAPAPAETLEPVAPTTEPEPEPGETTEPEPGEPTEPEPEPAEPQALSQKQIDRMHDQFERETARHNKRMGEIMGAELEMLLICPLCEPNLQGYIMPAPNLPERFPNVRAFMGDSQPRELRPDPHARQCELCGGEGVVDTGSHVQGQSELPCQECGGKGWIGDRGAVAAVPPASAPAVPERNGPLDIEPGLVDPPEVAELKRRGYVVLDPPRV